MAEITPKEAVKELQEAKKELQEAEKEIQEDVALMREGNISLILEEYNDIFSDFDPRPYEHKALSDDFLTECRKAARDKDVHELELRLLMPKEIRNLDDEAKIKHRLHEHFHKHFTKVP